MDTNKALTILPAEPAAGGKRGIALQAAALKTAICKEYAALGAELRGGIRALNDREVRLHLAEDALFLLLCAALLAFMRGSVTELFLSALIPSLGIAAVLVLLSEAVWPGARAAAMTIAVLILIGFFLQSSLAAEREAPEMLGKFVLFSAIGIAFGLGLGLPLIRVFDDHLKPAPALRLLQTAAIGAYLLLLASPSVNGAHNWITLGGISLQLTELCKIEACLATGIVVRAASLSDRKRFTGLALVLAPHLLFLALCNELSTAIILAAVGVMMAGVFLRQGRRLVVACVLCALAAGCALLPCRAAYCKLHPAEEAAPAAAEASPLEHRLADVYEKIHMRVLAVTDEEQAGDFGYQQTQAKKARLLAGWFGSDSRVPLPVAESDFAFSYLILKMGLLTGILVLLLWCAMPLAAAASLRSARPAAMAMLTTMLLTNLASAASACGFIPVMGVGAGFLSCGGTQSLANFSMSLYLLSCSEERRIHDDKNH